VEIFADEQTEPGVIHQSLCPTIYLYPGQLMTSQTPCHISTILGTCVAVCLHDPVLRISGINHYLLPHRADSEPSPRFGHVAIPRLVDQMIALGAWTGRLQAKVFGGSDPIYPARAGGDLGQRNVELALRMLAELEIPVVARDTGGPLGRKLILRTDDGTVWVRKL
jgi:chemotaxis protein CheD